MMLNTRDDIEWSLLPKLGRGLNNNDVGTIGGCLDVMA
jgi:hypothetical protein